MQFKIGLLAILGLLINIVFAQLVPFEFDEDTFRSAMAAKAQSEEEQGKKILYQENAPDYRGNDEGDSPQSLFDHLPRDPSLSTFLDILMQVDDILQLVNDPYAEPKFTLFTPTNTAFKKYMSEGNNRATLYTEDGFKNFLLCHLVPHGKYNIKDLEKSKTLETAATGRTISVEYHWISGITLDKKAKVDSNAIKAINGIAYKIDHVLEQAK
ncbi:Fasciclin domain-containing protein [Umbelopsis sp. PMI_123]|nr:Fasciclin domain-containing protein [Umbelopsis sp. PMI_123]